MKKIFKLFGAFLIAALMGAFSACNILDPNQGMEDLGLGIKVFFPTKVVAGQPMTINGSGFLGAREIVFPGNVKVTNFEIVSNEMIRVTAPAGIAAAGGKLVVNTADQTAESKLDLTLGSTQVTGYSHQEGEEISGGEQLTVYGQDLEFICDMEILDPDGQPLIVPQESFYRKGTSTVVITLPKKIFEGTYAAKLHTFDGKEILLPELSYKPGAEGGHWETKKTIIWENPDPDGIGRANWNGTYRFALEGTDTNNEAIAELPADVWEKLKTETFYVTFSHDDWFQMRIVTGWWNNQWPFGKDDDITPNAHTDMLIDNGDGTYSIEINLADTDLAANMDVEHLLFTGSGHTVLELFFQEEIWVGGDEEPKEVAIWTNDDPAGHGPANWNGTYRFALEGTDTNSEAIAEIPADTWAKMKTETFYVTFSHDDWFQMRIVTGWWNNQWPFGKDDDITPNAHTDMLIDNGDGTYSIEINLADTDLAANMDVEHLLFTGSGHTVLELFFQEEIWVGGDEEPKEVAIWTNDDPAGHGPANWNGTYRFALEGTDTNSEAIAEIPADTWAKMKTETFYVTFSHDDWFQMRIVTGWWNNQWPFGKDDDITPNAHTDMLIDNGDGTYTIEINLADTDLAANMDVEHLLFTGSGHTVLKLYFLE